VKLVALRDVQANARRGGEIFTLLSPATVGSTSGFMGVATLQPGEIMGEHYHPYSEEFAYVTQGELTAEIDGVPHRVAAGEAFYLPIDTRHRLRNDGDVPVELVFHLGPLAPRPELGHVDTEEPATAPATSAPEVAP
jgi:putative monooxygenase